MEECPFAVGATSIAHKEVLNRMEDASPGAKHNFLFGFLDRARAAFEQVENVVLNECTSLRPGDHRHALRLLQARRPGQAVCLNGGPRNGPPCPPMFGVPRRSRGTPLSRARFGSRDIGSRYMAWPRGKPWRSSLARSVREPRHW